VRGSVDLDEVERRSALHLEAGLALVAGLRGTRSTAHAVDRFCQQSGGCRLTSASRTGEEVGVCHAICGDGALQSPRRRLLANQVAEALRAVLAVEGLISHRRGNQARHAYGRAPFVDRGTPSGTGFPAPARVAAAPPSCLLTAASFRTCRGSEARPAQAPAFSAFHPGRG